MSVDIDRRTLLGVGCAGCVALVAGCGSSDDSSTPAAGTTSASSSSAPAASASASAGSSGGTAKPLVALSSIAVGEAASATSPDGKAVLITRTGDTTAVGFSARCTHMGCTVAAAGTQLKCPCHGSVFKASDGSVVSGPAPSPLAAYAVQVVDGQVVPA